MIDLTVVDNAYCRFQSGMMHTLLAFAFFAVVVPGLSAQSSPDSAPDTGLRMTPSPRARPLLPRAYVLAVGTATLATVALFPVDARVQELVQRSDLQSNIGLQRTASTFAVVGGPAPFVAAASLLLTGRLLGFSPLAHVGVHLAEGVTLAATVNAVGKGIAGRTLPNEAGNEPGEFSLGRGFRAHNGPYVSFPSGHTAAAFASAAVLTAEAERWRPALRWVVGPIVYGGAALVAASRLYQNVHWASDLPLAAVIGTLSGRMISGRPHSKSLRRLDGWLSRANVLPQRAGGVTVAWSSIPAL